MPADRSKSPSHLLDYLPAIYQDDPFLGQFLHAFEAILLGGDALPETADPALPEAGLEETIAGLVHYFDPLETPYEFLSWLASWAAFSLRADLEGQESIQRNFVANIFYHYQRRGTKANLQELLSIFVGGPEILETSSSEFQIGVHSRIGVDTYLRGGSPHFFEVKIVLPKDLQGKPKALARKLEIARSLIELEKPAHTQYKLTPIYPGTICIGDRKSSVLGVNTLLGTMPALSIPNS